MGGGVPDARRRACPRRRLVDVEVEPDDSDEPEDPALREAALRYGWGEPLSLVRRGFRCAWGTGWCHRTGTAASSSTGRLHDVAIVLVELVALGWSVLGDRIVPTSWNDGELIAHHRDAPVLISQRRARRHRLRRRGRPNQN